MDNVTVSTKGQQDVTTPMDFIERVCRVWPCGFDLAATRENKRFIGCFTPEDDALSPSTRWDKVFARRALYLWLNPPFRNVTPWMERCVKESRDHGCKIVALAQADRSTRWYRRIVRGNALALLLLNRIQFVGHEYPFPKPLQLLIFDGVVSGEGEFDWKAVKVA